MAKLHELIACESDLRGNAQRVRLEAIETFGRRERFEGHIKTLAMFDEARSNENAAGSENVAVTTTVGAKLDYVKDPIGRYLDACLQKEATNQTAKADLVLEDGTVIAAGVPATALLGLETKLKEIRQMYEAIPTHKPGVEWAADPALGEGIFRAVHPEVTNKTEMSCTPIILAPATDKHAAQVRAVDTQKPVGAYTKISFTGTVSPAWKSEKLAKIDLLIRAAKQARQRANEAEVVKATWAEKLFGFIG